MFSENIENVRDDLDRDELRNSGVESAYPSLLRYNT